MEEVFGHFVCSSSGKIADSVYLNFLTFYFLHFSLNYQFRRYFRRSILETKNSIFLKKTFESLTGNTSAGISGTATVNHSKIPFFLLFLVVFFKTTLSVSSIQGETKSLFELGHPVSRFKVRIQCLCPFLRIVFAFCTFSVPVWKIRRKSVLED